MNEKNCMPSENDLKSFRPIPFYFITTTEEKDLSYEAVYASLKQLKDDGFGGLILFNKPESGFNAEQYLSKAWFDMVKTFVRVCGELDLSLWINDGFNFPPGDVGGRINKEEYPELTPLRIALEDGNVSVKEVPWGFPAFELSETAELFHKLVYEAYLREVGEHFGKTIKGFFSDADNRRVSFRVFWPDFPVKEYYPWSKNFAESFADKFGYDITPYLADILSKKSIPQAADYWQHAGELYQSWFRSNYEWCKAHGLKYSFHTSDTAPFPMDVAPRSSAFTEGRAITMEQNSSYPGTDQELLEINGGRHMRQDDYWVPKSSWGGDNAFVCNPDFRNVVSDLRTKQAASSAFLYHKEGALCEMFAATNWGATPQNLREIAAWQIMQGITFIVPHAYHHRFCGELKFFAPPDFSPRSHLSFATKELNDMLSTCVFYATRGKYNTKVAVLDLTEDVWLRHDNTEAYFNLCAELNRLPYGYVIAGLTEIRANKSAFSVLFNAGSPLSDAVMQELAEMGITVLSPSEISRLGKLVPCNISYSGEGSPHFMCRLLGDGQELVLLANIEDGKPISGTLTLHGASYPVSLECGEIAVFSKNGQIEYRPKVSANGEQLALVDAVPVTWEKENIVPLEMWKDSNGNAVTKSTKQETMYFTYTIVDNQIQGLNLLVASTALKKINMVKLNGEPLTVTSEKIIGDECYQCFALPCSTPGEYTITIEKAGVIEAWELMSLAGEFDVDISTENPFYEVIYNQYSLDRYIPEKATVTLSSRTTQLAAGDDWCRYGHPFYSGGATYHFVTELDNRFSSAVLKAENVRDMLSVSVDGSAPQKCIYPPYAIELGNMSHQHRLDVTVYNTLANTLEGYQAPSGLLGNLSIQAK